VILYELLVDSKRRHVEIPVHLLALISKDSRAHHDRWIMKGRI
jgi:hypothetical protein